VGEVFHRYDEFIQEKELFSALHFFFYLKCVPTSSLAKGNDPPDEFPPMFII